MSSERLSEIFDDCLVRLAAGATVEQCLRDYSGDSDRLRPLLETVTLMRRALPPAYEVMAAQDHVRATMTTAMQSVNAVPRRPRTASPRRWVSALTSAALLIFALLGALGYAAEGALPGDPLYPFKLVSEAARLSVIHDPALAEAFAQRRVDEVRTVLADGRQVSVSFAAPVVSINGARWDVGGVPVEVSTATRMTEPIRPGDEVEVEGFASAGVVRADEIEKLTPNQPMPTPTSMPSVTPAPGISLTLIPRDTETPVVPTATAEGSCTPSAPAGWVSYSVRAGDTASELAAATSISLDTLLTVNCLTNARLLVVGQQIFLPFTPPTQVPRATVAPPVDSAQPANNGGGDHVDAGGSTQGSGSGSAVGNDDHGGSSNSGSGGSNDDGGSSGSDNSGSGSSNSGSGNSGSDDGGNSGSDDSGSSGHGSSNDDGGGHGGSNDDG